jgi:hypothetical protein
MLFSILNIADGITAFFIKQGESNPIFLLTGSMWILIGYKIFIVILVWWIYIRSSYPSNFTYFLIILILVFGCLGFGLGLFSNIYGIMHPSVVREAASYSTGEKIQQYSITMGVFLVLPMVFNLITFWVYEKSRKKVEIKNAD